MQLQQERHILTGEIHRAMSQHPDTRQPHCRLGGQAANLGNRRRALTWPSELPLSGSTHLHLRYLAHGFWVGEVVARGSELTPPYGRVPDRGFARVRQTSRRGEKEGSSLRGQPLSLSLLASSTATSSLNSGCFESETCPRPTPETPPALPFKPVNICLQRDIGGRRGRVPR